jgi:general secretion pathway protein I
MLHLTDLCVFRVKQTCSEGFTLIEMMVALAVFSLAALALLRLQGATVRNVATIESRTFGQIVANNLAVEVLTDQALPPLGKSEGIATNGGRTWRWARLTKRTADSRIIRVDISVVDEFGAPAGALSLARPVA